MALNTIITNNLNTTISSFFFCILLFYLFFEVFFSFLRKLYQNKSPVFPDDKHLHMLSFVLVKKYFGYHNGNYINSIIINFFILLFLPSIYFAENGFVCKYLVFFFSIYLFVYLLKTLSFNKK